MRDWFEARPLPDPWVAGRPNFFEPAEYRLDEWAEVFDGHQIELLLLERYVGRLSLEESSTGGTMIELTVRLEPNRPVLVPTG